MSDEEISLDPGLPYGEQVKLHFKTFRQAFAGVKIDKRYVIGAAILLWLHGVTTGMVVEGQKGFANQLLWTLVFFSLPLSGFLIPEKGVQRLCVRVPNSIGIPQIDEANNVVMSHRYLFCTLSSHHG